MHYLQIIINYFKIFTPVNNFLKLQIDLMKSILMHVVTNVPKYSTFYPASTRKKFQIASNHSKKCYH